MTKSITATLPDESVEWLRETYPDATSDSQRIAMAISDARLLRGSVVSVSGAADEPPGDVPEPTPESGSESDG